MKAAAYEGGIGECVEITEHSHAGMAAAYTAGASRLPFGVLRGYIGTDLPGVNDRVRRFPGGQGMVNRLGNQPLRLVPGARPAVQIGGQAGVGLPEHQPQQIGK